VVAGRTRGSANAGSVLLAGVLLKMGTYGLLRFNVGMFRPRRRTTQPGSTSSPSSGSLRRAGGSGPAEPEELIAYSSVSHLGFVVLGIFSLTTVGTDGAVYRC